MTEPRPSQDPSVALLLAAREVSQSAESDQSVLRLGAALLRRRYLLIGLPIAIAVVTVGFSFLSPREFTSRAVFLPEGGESPSGGLSNVASQFGISLPGQSGPSPQFYADLLRAPSILRALADSSVRVGDGQVIPLSEFFGITDENPRFAREIVMLQLRDRVRSSVETKTSTVRYSVTTEDPGVSHWIATEVLSQVNRFNMQRRRERAAQEQIFFEERLRASMEELRAAEARLESFLLRNRRYQDDPQLALEHQRLLRDQELKERVYTSLAEMLERAAIESSRTTPTISIVEAPLVPVFADTRPVALYAVIALLVGFATAVLLALILDQMERLRQRDPDNYNEFTSLSRSLVNDLTQPVKSLRSAMNFRRR